MLGELLKCYLALLKGTKLVGSVCLHKDSLNKTVSKIVLCVISPTFFLGRGLNACKLWQSLNGTFICPFTTCDLMAVCLEG